MPNLSSSITIAKLVCAWLILLAGAPMALAGDWPQFRGPSGLGYADENNLPLTWDAKTSENVLWKVALPKNNNPYSSPIVWGDRVFSTTALNNPLEHRVACYRASDGATLWETLVPPGPWILKDLRGGYGAPTPCADGERVYVLFGSAVVAALDFSGKIVWRKELEKLNFDVAIGSSPILYQDTLILDCDQTKQTSSFIAFDKRTGAVRWEAKRPDVDFSHSTPVLATVQGKPMLFVSASNALQGLDPTNGSVLWRCAAKGDASSPAFGGGLVYCDSGRGDSGVAIEPTGAGDVTKTHLKWKTAQLPEGLSSPIIVGEYLYRTHIASVLKCFRLSNGEVVFSERLEGISTHASPITTPDGRIYFASAGKSVVIKAGPKLEILARNDLADPNFASPAVSGGRIFLKGTKNLFCIGKK
ncbi:MAG: PQQ-like beta-propeller repeat protein [Candidatus Sumerlaeota bacterium]|nr:PQQ-like beta-propeller repeat protein [Candidatus Sumerlaeota bacterium]